MSKNKLTEDQNVKGCVKQRKCIVVAAKIGRVRCD